MRPIAGTQMHGVHKDLFGDQVDDQEQVSLAYEYVWEQGALYLSMHPELRHRIVDQTVVDVVFEPVDDQPVQRIEWQCLVRV